MTAATSTPMPRSAVVLAWVLVIGGALLTSWGWFNLRDARASADWPWVEGRVLSSSVRRSRSSNSQSSSTGYRYSPRVEFEYTAEGVRTVGDRISYRDDHYGSRAKALQIADRFAAGSSVDVYYKPGSPATAVIDLAWDWSTYLPLGISSFLFLCGCALVWAARAQARRLSPRDPV